MSINKIFIFNLHKYTLHLLLFQYTPHKWYFQHYLTNIQKQFLFYYEKIGEQI